jgi:hypothetical protein
MVLKALKRKISPNNSFWGKGAKTRSNSKKLRELSARASISSEKSIQRNMERGDRSIVNNTQPASLLNERRETGGATYNTTNQEPPDRNNLPEPPDGDRPDKTMVPMDTSDISDLSYKDAHHSPGSNNQVRLSEDDYNTPEIIGERLKGIYHDLHTLRNLDSVRDGTKFVDTTHKCITTKLDDLNRHVVMNGMTDEFSNTLIQIQNEADKIRKEIISNTRSTESALGAIQRDTRFASAYARSMSESQTASADRNPVFNTDEDVTIDASMHGFTGWSHQKDTDDVQQRLSERIASISVDIEDKKSDIEKQFEKLKRGSKEIMAASLASQKTAATAQKAAAAASKNIEKLSNRITNLEKIPMLKRKDEFKDIQERLEAVENELKSKVNSESLNKQISTSVSAEVRLANGRQLLDIAREVEKAVKLSKEQIIKELTPLYTNLNQVPTPNQQSGPSNPEEISDLVARVVKIERLACQNKSKADALISSDKKSRAHMKTLQESVDAGIVRTSTPFSSQNSSEGNSTKAAHFSKRNLESMIERIQHYSKSQVSENADIAEIRKRHDLDLPKVAKELDKFSKLIAEYLKNDIIDEDFYNSCILTSDEAWNWTRKVEELYDKWDVHAVDHEKNKHIVAVKTFTGDHKQTVYEFLEEFEAAYLTVGVSKTRAGIMHQKCLSEWIQSQTMHVATEYNALKNWLINKHGDIITIVSKLIAPLESMKKPSQSAYKDRLEFFLKISNFMMRIERMSTMSQIPSEKVNEHLHSRLVLEKLVSILPNEDDIKLMENLRANGMDTSKFQGKFTYTVYKDYIHAQVDNMQRAVERTAGAPTGPSHPSKPKVKTTNSATLPATGDQSDIESDDEAGFSRVTLTATAQNNKPKAQKWWTNGLKFPCPMNGHDHELSTCEGYFALTPKERRLIPKRALTRHRRICWSCLRPTDTCNKACMRNPAVTDVLKCQGCTEYANANNIPALSPLYCLNPDHNDIKPQPAHFLKELKKYFKGSLSSGISEKNIAYSNYGYMSFNSSSTHKKTKSRPPCPESFPTAFDTKTGEKADNKELNPKDSPQDDAFFLMQWINIGASECLVLFDRGSNVNLIDGNMAEREGLQVMSDKTAAIKVVGGEEVSTQFGKYKVILGSKDTGEFHTLVCHGISQVTTELGRYPLHEINHEVRTQTNVINPCDPLPASVGGSTAHLLIGIKDIALDPVLLTTLQSGIGVYRSPFTDKYGSNICYGGAHPVFSKTNSQLGHQLVLSSMFVSEIQSARNHIFEAIIIDDQQEKSIPYTLNGPHGTKVYPTPLTCTDFQDLGCTIQDESDDENSEPQDECTVHLCAANKATIPISKMRELIDQDDLDDTTTYRCPKCSKCITCKKSSKESATSIQDMVEQQAIRDSVIIEDGKVWVDVPFTKDPDTFLTKRHHGNSNRAQAMKVYRTQCRHPDKLKDGMRKVHSDLVEQGFIIQLADLPEETQRLIEEGAFHHFMPWRIVEKTDSISTSIRMVVDPTMTGLNIILPKGENNLGRMNDILIRARVGEYLWTTDIKKMYNQLNMRPSSYRFQLMLYDDELDPNSTPETWVMKTAWYGVTSSGNQAGDAVNQLKEENKEKHPHAEAPLSQESRFVDDIGSTAATEAEREQQIKDVTAVLGKGGFSLKFIVRSGHPPDEKASPDGETVKLLGYKYDTEKDLLSPTFNELNLNKKVRGARKPNVTPVTTTKEALQLLQSIDITRRMAMSKLAEFFDPIGLYEPIKLQLKLALSALNEYSWDQSLPHELQLEWRPRLAQLMELPNLKTHRNVITVNNGHSPIRLLCLSDAGEMAGGAVVYAGVKLQDGSFSCGMVASKSKLMTATVPRNELSAIMLMTELAFIVKRAIGDRVNEIIYLTDSTIALSWCLNTTIKLRLYVYNRVETIRRMIEWTTEADIIPLYHIDGEQNIADLITKPNQTTIQDVMIDSEWQVGKNWMKLPSESLPITSYEHINLPSKKQQEIKQECFDEPFFLENKEKIHGQILSHILAEPENENLTSLSAGAAPAPPLIRTPFMVDLVGKGWTRGIRITAKVLKYIAILKHKAIHSRKNVQDKECMLCMIKDSQKTERDLLEKAEREIFAHETKEIMKHYKKSKWEHYLMQDQIMYFSGRLSKENPFRFKDLDSVPFLDAHEIGGVVPVVFPDSDVFFSYLMAVHTKIAPHSGIITTTKEIAKKMHIPNSAKRVIEKVRADCTRCKLILKKTVELEMQKHAFPRTMIAPPFYNSMIDIAYGFPGIPYKNARKRVHVYALVIVCILTGATNIIALEGIETQDIILAIETHSSYYGVPAEVFIDNGTQLKAMEHASFSITDLEAYVYDSVGMKVTVSAAKSHEERGRVERKIGLIRSMIERSIDPKTAQSAMQWQALFAKIANALDNLPMAKGNTSNESHLGFEILTPNRLKMGRNNNRSLASTGISLDMSGNLTRLLDRNRQMYHTWYQLYIDNIHLLAMKPNKWHTNSQMPKHDDIVIFVQSDAGYRKKDLVWKLGRIVEVNKSRVKILSFTKSSKRAKVQSSTFERNVREVSILFSLNELYVNSREYFQDIIQKK